MGAYGSPELWPPDGKKHHKNRLKKFFKILFVIIKSLIIGLVLGAFAFFLIVFTYLAIASKGFTVKPFQ